MFRILTFLTLMLSASAATFANNLPAPTAASPTPVVLAKQQVNINTASVKELTHIAGINTAKARAIVAYRKKHGSFKTIGALSKVRGFSKLQEDELKEMTDQLQV